MSSVLVTGCNGYIGSHVVKQLAELSAGYAKFLKGIEYDFDKWKEEVTAAHEFIASKMGG